MSRLQQLKDVERAARRLIKEGLRLTPYGLMVLEADDKSDPHYELCIALEAFEPLKPIPHGKPPGTCPPQNKSRCKFPTPSNAAATD